MTWSRRRRLLCGLAGLGAWCACNSTAVDAKPPYGFACNPSNISVDADGDLYYTPLDCNDDDPEIHPGAQEVCDDIDNDCDGQVDEFTTRTLPYVLVGVRNDDPVVYDYDDTGDFEDPVRFNSGLEGDDEAAGILMVDLDDDGIQEVIMQSREDGWVAAYTIQCDRTFHRSQLFEVTGYHRLRGAGDIDGDGDRDMVGLDPVGWTGEIYLNDGEGGFERQEQLVNWGVFSGLDPLATVADSQVLMDVTGDGLADWMICYGLTGSTYCYRADGQENGLMAEPVFYRTISDVEANSITLGYFTQDEVPDMILGLAAQGSGDDLSSPVFKLEGLAEGGFAQSADYLFDLALEVEGQAWGYDPDELGDGWLRTLDLTRHDDGQSELLIITYASRDGGGWGLIYVQDPLDVDPAQGVLHKQLRPLYPDLVADTSSLDPHLYSVVAAGIPIDDSPAADP